MAWHSRAGALWAVSTWWRPGRAGSPKSEFCAGEMVHGGRRRNSAGAGAGGCISALPLLSLLSMMGPQTLVPTGPLKSGWREALGNIQATRPLQQHPESQLEEEQATLDSLVVPACSSCWPGPSPPHLFLCLPSPPSSLARGPHLSLLLSSWRPRPGYGQGPGMTAGLSPVAPLVASR